MTNDMSRKYSVASSPHWRFAFTLSNVQRLWLLALAPAMVASIWMYGWHAARVMGLAIFFAVAFDALANRIIPSKDSTANFSSVTLAIILAFMMPYDSPWWLILVGSFIMIVVGKKLFGGTGAYPAHPAMLAFAMLLVSWPGRFDYTRSLLAIDWGTKMVEPLRLVKTLGGYLSLAGFVDGPSGGRNRQRAGSVPSDRRLLSDAHQKNPVADSTGISAWSRLHGLDSESGRTR